MIFLYVQGRRQERRSDSWLWSEAIQILTLTCCSEKGIKLNKNKFKLWLKEMPLYIGCILTSKGLKPDPHKEQAIMDYETTKNVADVQRFFGPVSYLAKFMINLKLMSNPIHPLIHQNIVWKWTEEHEVALSQALVFRYFDSKEETTFQCNASSTGLGATLLQLRQSMPAEHWPKQNNNMVRLKRNSWL